MATERPMIATANRFTAWYILAAVLFILLGLFAIIEPATAAIGIAVLLGWLLIFGGLAHFITTFKGGSAKWVLFQVLSAIVFVLGGLYILTHPLLAVGTLTAQLARCNLRVGNLRHHHLLPAGPRLPIGLDAVEWNRRAAAGAHRSGFTGRRAPLGLSVPWWE